MSQDDSKERARKFLPSFLLEAIKLVLHHHSFHWLQYMLKKYGIAFVKSRYVSKDMKCNTPSLELFLINTVLRILFMNVHISISFQFNDVTGIYDANMNGSIDR